MRAGNTIRCLLAAAVTAVVAMGAAPAQAGMSLVPAFSGSVSQPMYVTAPPGDSHRLFIVTRPGVIRVAVDGVLQTAPFLDISSRVWTSGEAGMASMAFDPGYENPASPGYGLFYVYFVQKPSGGETNGPIHIEAFSADPVASPNVASATARLVLAIPHNDANNHYGGTMQFNPSDGLLYIGTGDGGGSDNQFGNAQSTKTLLGKLLRIDPRQSGADPYSVPGGNPFHTQPLCNPAAGTTDCPEILAWGLRNPFRWSFDRSSGDIAIADVGQSQWEEVDYVPASAPLAGDDFGWPCREGPVAYHTNDSGCAGTSFSDPVWSYSHTGLSGPVAITGGIVARDPALTPIYGRYLWADFYQGLIHSQLLATPSSTDDRLESLPKVAQLVSFGEDADAHVYVVSLAGAVSRIACDSSCTATSGGGSQPPADTSTQVSQAPPAEPAAPPVARDSTAPRLRVRAARLQDALRRGAVRLSIGCDEACIVRVSARARGLRLRGALERLAADQRELVELKLSARASRMLARRGGVAIALRGRDAAGNLRTASLTVRVRR